MSVTLFAIALSGDHQSGPIRAPASPLLANWFGPGVEKAANFSFRSSEHLSYLQIPSRYVTWHQTFTVQVSFLIDYGREELTS